jgi:hypothetical protein
MDNITIPVDDIVKNGLSINEYLLLYNISNGYAISGLLDPSLVSLSLLEKKGFIKLSDNQVFLRDKAKVFFNKDEDLFLVWLKTYPTKVVKKSGGKRALSPSSPDTILGKRLKKKWREVLKNNVGKQQIAIKVLELQVKDMTKSGDLEYMVEAHRWLNEGYHEKYSYLVDEEKPQNHYENEDYL